MAFGLLIGGGAGNAFDPVGSHDIPIYIDTDDEAKACDGIADSLLKGSTSNSAEKLIYVNPSTGDKTDYAVGTDGKTLVYFKNGVPVASAVTVGSSTKPVYLNGGVVTQCEDSLDVNISGVASKVSCTSGNSFQVVGAKGIDSYNKLYYNSSVTVNSNNVLMGAAWNDYAEFRESVGEAGDVVCEDASGVLQKSKRRLQKCAYIISDTFGFTVGRHSEVDRPIAVSGRVLAKSSSKLKVGDVVCSGKNGTVSKMNRLEIILFPDRIIGIVSEVPSYTKWNDIEIKDRVWIKVK